MFLSPNTRGSNDKEIPESENPEEESNLHLIAVAAILHEDNERTPRRTTSMPPRRYPRRNVVVRQPDPVFDEVEEEEEEEEEGSEESEEFEEIRVGGQQNDEDEDMDEVVAPVNPFNRMTALEYKQRRFHDQFSEGPNCDDPRFHTRFQEDVYNWIYMNKSFAPHTWFQWSEVDRKREYPGLHNLFTQIGLDEFLVLRQDYNSELIKQFYSTLFIDAEFQIIKWRTGNENCIASHAEFASSLGIAHLMGEAKIHDEPELSVQEKLEFYQPYYRGLPGRVTGLYTIPSVVHRFIKSTIYPRMGNKDQVRDPVWNIIAHVMRGQPFDVIDCIIREMHESKGEMKVKGIYYAPHIMRLLLARVPGLAGEYLDGKHKIYTPRERNPVAHPVPGVAPLDAPQHIPEQAPFEFGVPPSQYSPFMGALVGHFQQLSTTMSGMAEREIARDQLLQGMREDISFMRQRWQSLESRVSDLEDRVKASLLSRRRRHRSPGDSSGPSSSH